MCFCYVQTIPLLNIVFLWVCVSPFKNVLYKMAQKNHFLRSRTAVWVFYRLSLLYVSNNSSNQHRECFLIYHHG